MLKKTLKRRSNTPYRKLLIIILVFLTQSHIMAFQKPLRTITCSSASEVLRALDNVQPGDEIIITEGVYTIQEKYIVKKHITLAPRLYSKVNGTPKNPIIIRGEKSSSRPILQGSSNAYDGYVFLLEGDNWIIKDLVLRGGSKGLVLDNANSVTIDNIEIYDIASEGIHVRDGSSNTLIQKCYLHDLGLKKPANGEGIYIGSDAKEHNGNFNPYCDDTIIKDCTFGPNISAEAIDVKEEVDGVKIYGNVFSAKGIVGDTRNDAFIDVKGINAYIYNNTFNVDNGGINAGIDVIQKKPKNGQNPITKTGYRVAVFKNTFNFGDNNSQTPFVRFKGGKPFDIHVWDNNTKPQTRDRIVSTVNSKIINSCPTWSIVSCDGLGNNNPEPSIPSTPEPSTIPEPEPTQTPEPTPIPEPTPTSNPNPSSCSFGAPQNNSLSTLKIKYKTISVLGNGGPNASHLTKLSINWNASKKGLYSFAFNTSNGKPAYYVDLKKSTNTFGESNPYITIDNSGIPSLDGSYWIVLNEDDFVLVSKSGGFSIYCSNSNSVPSCVGAKSSVKTVAYTVSPNPASEVIRVSGISEAKLTATIYDLQGKRILQETLRKEKNSINVSTLKAGMYIMRVIGSEIHKSQLITIK